jgi:hypothetical protein
MADHWVRTHLTAIRAGFGISESALSVLTGMEYRELDHRVEHPNSVASPVLSLLRRLEHRASLWAQNCEYPLGVHIKSKIDGYPFHVWCRAETISDEAFIGCVRHFAVKLKARAERLERATMPAIPLVSRALDTVRNKVDD